MILGVVDYRMTQINKHKFEKRQLLGLARRYDINPSMLQINEPNLLFILLQQMC